MNGMEGWGRLGQALAGGNTGAAYERGAQSAARVANWLADARKAETEGRLLLDKERARQQFESSLVASGETPDTAKMLSNAFGAGYNPEQLSGYQTDRQKIGLSNEAAAAARGGDIDLMNNLLTAFQGKPRERTNITGGVAYDPYAAPGQPVAVTPTGQADIGATQALATQRYASAGENNAHAALYGRTDPNRSAAGSNAYTAPTQGSLAASFAGEDGAVASDQARDFMIWRQANPQYRNGEQALAAYLAASGGGSDGVQIISANRPGSMTIRPPNREDETKRMTAELASTGATPEMIDEILTNAFAGKDFKVVQPAGNEADAGAARAPATRAWSQADALQALADAREAVRRGALSREQAQQRLLKAGLGNVAGRL